MASVDAEYTSCKSLVANGASIDNFSEGFVARWGLGPRSIIEPDSIGEELRKRPTRTAGNYAPQGPRQREFLVRGKSWHVAAIGLD